MISIIEFLVYGLITYGTFLFMIYSSMSSAPLSLSMASVRIMCVAPALIFSLALVIMSPEIILYEEESITTYSNSTVTTFDTATTNTTYSINLQNQAWGNIHLIFFFIFFFYIILNMFSILTKKSDTEN